MRRLDSRIFTVAILALAVMAMPAVAVGSSTSGVNRVSTPLFVLSVPQHFSQQYRSLLQQAAGICVLERSGAPKQALSADRRAFRASKQQLNSSLRKAGIRLLSPSLEEFHWYTFLFPNGHQISLFGICGY